MPLVEPTHAVVLLVGREEFTTPDSFGGSSCVATVDCVAVALVHVTDEPTLVTLAVSAPTDDQVELGRFEVESEGLLSLRDVYNCELDAAGVEPGLTTVVVWAGETSRPSRITFQVQPSGPDPGLSTP